MADNKVIDNGGGGGANFTAATDEIGGVDYQYVKLVDGTANSTEAIPGDNVKGLTVLPSNQVAGTATLTNQTDQATNVTLLASNADRKGAIIWNDSTSILYIKFGATATATSNTYKIPPDSIWEMLSGVIYTGIIDGIWSADASGSARITELT